MALGATINVCADSVKVDEGGSALAACGNQGIVKSEPLRLSGQLGLCFGPFRRGKASERLDVRMYT